MYFRRDRSRERSAKKRKNRSRSDSGETRIDQETSEILKRETQQNIRRVEIKHKTREDTTDDEQESRDKRRKRKKVRLHLRLTKPP